MEEWKEYKIGDVCASISDTYKGKASEVVLINTSDVLEGKCLNHKKTPNRDLKGQFKKSFQKDDILYSEIRPANKRFAYIDFEPTDYIASTKLMVIRSNENIDSQYLFYILKSQSMLEELQMLAESRSGTFPQITFSELANLSILLPPIDEQKRILSILKSLDDKIECNRRINENLEQQAQALFKSWFVDFEPFKDQPFVESELGMIPQGWEVKRLSDIMEISKKSINPSKNPESFFAHYSIPAYDNGMRPESQLGKEILSNKFVIGNGMTLFSKLNPRIKRIWFVDKVEENSICSTEFVPYIAKDTKLSAFANSIISSKNFYDFVMSMVNGATGSHQRFHPEESLTYLTPYNYKVALEFNMIVEPLLSKMMDNRVESRRLAELRDTLLPRLMSGEINVNEVCR